MIWDNGVLVVTPKQDTTGAMWRKMWQRAGVDPATVQVMPLEDWPQQLNPGARPFGPDIHTVVTMGERALNVVTLQSDLFRWRGRSQAMYNWGLPVVVVATMRVTDLLPFIGNTNGHVQGSQLSNRPARYQGVWIRDVQHALTNGGVINRFKDNYLIDPKTPQEWNSYVQKVLSEDKPISFDIETQYTPKGLKSEEDFEDADAIAEGAVLRCSFSNRPHTGASIPWNPEFLPGIRALLTSPLPKVGWNCLAFDVPKLSQEGITVGGRIRDFQDAWHLLESDVPKGLEWVSSFYTNVGPWKHLSDINPGRYAAIDADVALQNAIGIEKDLRHYGQWDLFERHVTDLMPTLRRAGERGNLIDMEYQPILKAEMEEEKQKLRDSADKLVPRVVKPRARVATLPADGVDYDVVMLPAQVKTCSVCGAEMPNKSAHTKGGKKNPCSKAVTVLVDGQRPWYDLVEPFNLGSSDQLQAYAKHFGHPLGWNPKTKAPTMDANHIEKLAKKYPTHTIYNEQLQYSKVAKTLSTYMYIPDNLGLIHTQYVNAPSTWRLASRNYNLQNVGKRFDPTTGDGNKWAVKARRQLVARPGHVFVQADSTSIEAVILGYLIDDPEFGKVAKKSTPAYLVCQELGLPFTDDMISKVKKEHKGLYNQFKTAVYLLLYGGDPYLMHMTNNEAFPTIQSAVMIQKKIFAILPKLKKWQERTREQAKREGVLQSPWGYRHRFYDVYTFKRDDQGNIEYDGDGAPKMRMGQDSKRALAFIPQNCAGAFCRDTLVLMGRSEWAQYMPANVSVHDSYCLEVPEEMADKAEQFLVDLLTRPVVELGGLRIGCEVDRGYNWADQTEDNPMGMKVQRKVEV